MRLVRVLVNDVVQIVIIDACLSTFWCGTGRCGSYVPDKLHRIGFKHITLIAFFEVVTTNSRISSINIIIIILFIVIVINAITFM